MRIATITNWAYGATVCLTIASGIIMLMASGADTAERQAIELRQNFDELTENIETDAWKQSDLARLYVIKKNPQILDEYNASEKKLKSIELKLEKLQDIGASDDELALLHDGLKIIDALQDEQQAALTSVARGEDAQAVALLYGMPYEQELERAQTQIDRFRQILDKRVIASVREATKKSKALRTASEVMVGLTALLFLFVLGFILKRRVLRPVVRLSDVVHRLASQDFAVETPNFNQIDEIGDMAQAIRIFRENGLARQRLEKERDADWAIRELLARMTQRLQGCENFDDVINVAELFAPNIAPGIAGRLYVFDRDPWQMRCVAQWLSPADDEATFHPDACWAVRRGQSHPPVNGEPDVACYHLPESQAESALCVPLIAQGEAIGLLSFQNITPENAPARAYLELMAEALGLALANQRLRNALLEKALFDPLTGLRNRHHLEDTLHTQMTQAMRNGEPLSCMMIDIDHFKSINDRFGHEAGDQVIKNVATIVQRAAHDGGLAFRYGGEEFLVLLPGAGEAEAHACAQKIYNGVHALSLRYGLTEIGPVDVSIGIASYPEHAQSDNLLRAADVALYRAKELGRSRIVSFGMLEAG
ncbi:diguanylate cyclase [Enterobacter cloacae complex sp. P3B]|uniref:diguanylate cyclase n=1 Tax=unclassified Enterobacter cloacae complex TaxID=2757714 RepID=UPI00186700C8|nr:diguanylate cyclase [Enterobacter cloacae complex sp. P26RS]MBE3433488.1 diguanylate cyclase [Enterobacter cloacae complex sp. P21RS]MBE3459361.1 diguanylate cyclase [Enterobacter cloacae complex sp. P21C]MBE3498519.1 diguanylate cyclase [Enterobacter cloacae complex sp. P2B]MBE3501708.1 diguanylate cyclase [Enterobacter cloacae complex sp. I11]MBE3518577.1 diguanylate cyclase [Enterobacter cloacae complex sp. I5]MBE3520408.1 diguanylate cyclase [Enterobacter cloacae complex sp. I6]MBE352